MNPRFTMVEVNLNRAEFRWKWLRFLRFSFILGVILGCVFLGLESAVLLGWAPTRPKAIGLCAVILLGAFLFWIALGLWVLIHSAPRPWLAAMLERTERRLMDRLNTLLALETQPNTAATDSFRRRIARQAHSVFAQKPVRPAFAGEQPRVWFLTFLAILLACWAVFDWGAPWSRLRAAGSSTRAAAGQNKPSDLELPGTNSVEQAIAWGEVRITEPGGDLRGTKVDVVPLQIEAASSQALQQVRWLSAINGATEQAHELPPPSEPRFAVYKPLIYLDEMKLADWDVLTYYASAGTAGDKNYASDVYFLEVRPFREDILKLPGGEQGKAYQALGEMSSLIQRQEHVIRQTHLHIQKPLEQESLQAQDRAKLADAETDLTDAARHLYAKMADEMENQAIGGALDSLAHGEQSLRQAAQHLSGRRMPEAQKSERGALTDLIAARKIFQKEVTDNPGAFKDEPENGEPAPPFVDETKKIDQIAEFRNESRAAEDFLRKEIEGEKALQNKAGQPGQGRGAGAEQEKLIAQLEAFQRDHPQVFKPAAEEEKAAREAMRKAREALKKEGEQAKAAVRQASGSLDKLAEMVSEQNAGRQLSDAYKLKRLLDKTIGTFDQGAGTNSSVSNDQLKSAAKDARNIVDQLGKAAEQEPTRNLFGQPLRDALTGEKKMDLDLKLGQFSQPGTPTEMRQRSAEAKKGLADVSNAFNASQPKALQMARNGDPLKPNPQDSFDQGMSELESLLKQLENNRQVPAGDKARQGRQALFDLQTGLRELNGGNQQSDGILLSLEHATQPGQPLDADTVRRLLDQLRHFSVEFSEKTARAEESSQMIQIDPSRLPAAYRGRIQKYFEKLSEKGQ